eukprot:CAMPEP_0203746238 /NCGR_PEP_ID=MMETSP0098-20131031/1733_1 /ASSEMBLY_ACC=CAM_ASM_000208 /TAXON_ID=96639 /ORGANISM=" , Strain NY0313808BC1" /LENGTH=40 /DNA_ID= /DNA_START= /DNA_END= /DNA_ORIENTATION=
MKEGAAYRSYHRPGASHYNKEGDYFRALRGVNNADDGLQV